MIWLLDLYWQWKQRRKLERALRKRKAVRKIEGERVRKGKQAAQRKAWANDPMRGVA